MYKHKLVLLLAWVLVVNAYGQTQLKNWYHSAKRLNFQGLPAIASTQLTGTPFHVSNMMSDSNGEVAFYCKIEGGSGYNTQRLEIYHRYNKTTPIVSEHVDGWTGWNQTELPIVPLIENNSCAKRFYVFYRNFDTILKKTVVYAKIVSCNIADNTVTVTDVMNGTKKRIVLSGAVHNDNKMGGLAAGKLNSFNTRYLYYIDGGVNRIAIYPYSLTNDGLGEPQMIVNATQYDGVRYQTLEVDISPDGSKLAWPLYDSTIRNQCTYYIFNVIATNGDLIYNKTVSITNFNDIEPKGRRCGLEFNDLGNVLYVTSGRYQSNDIKEGIYMFSGSNFSTLSYIDQPNCAWSQLERAYNGRIYASDNVSFYAVNQTTNALEPQYNLLNVASQRILYNLMNDQIDGENYDRYLPKYMIFDNIRDVNTGGYIPMSIPFGYNMVWNPAYFGGKTKVKFIHTISVRSPYLGYPNPTKLTIENLTVELYDNATFYVGDNSTLELKNTVLKGLDNPVCGTGMWGGVYARSVDSIWPAMVNVNPQTSDAQKCTIRDAVIGIHLYGPYSKLTANKNTFTANGIDIKFSQTGHNPFINIYNNFIDDIPLKNQNNISLGSNEGYVDGLKRTRYGIYIENTASFISVGQASFFQGGQFGVFADGASLVSVSMNTFNSQKQSALSINNYNGITNTTDNINVSNNIFNDGFNGISVSNIKYANIRLISNRMNNILNFGIDYTDNNGSAILIQKGSGSLPDGTQNGGVFYNCGSAAINFNNNADKNNTKIAISDLLFVLPNTPSWNAQQPSINNMGIIITESSGGTQKYKSITIDGNTITNHNYGIWLTNVVGGNTQFATYRAYKDPVNNFPITELSNNTININTSQTYHNGISLNASAGLSTLSNTLLPIKIANRYNTSISSGNAFNSLIYGNYTNTGLGFVPQGNMINSNYYCNNFNRAYTAIQLKNHTLRQMPSPNGTYYTHGIAPSESRHNIFANRPISGVDIDIAGSNVKLNKWIFDGATALPKIINSKVPTATNIWAGTGLNLCGNFTGPIDPETPPSFESVVLENTPLNNFWTQYYQQQQYNMGYAPNAAQDNMIAKLVIAEDTMAYGENYAAALSLINQLQPDSGNTILADYKTVYQTYLNYKLLGQANRTMSQADVNTLHTIASKNPVTQSPSAHTARAILWHERQLFYRDSEEVVLQLAGYMDANCGANITGHSVYLERSDNQLMQPTAITDSLGQFLFTQDAIAPFLVDTHTYRMFVLAPNGNTLYSPYASMKQLVTLSDYVFSCTQVFGKKGNTIVQPETTKSETSTNVKLELDIPISITPNPTTDNITIHNAPTNALVSIQNVLGAIVYSNNNAGTIDVSAFAKGVYFVTIHTNTTNHVQKISIR